MKQQIIRYFFIAVLLGIGYFFSTNHIIIMDRDFYTLKKSYLTFEYTFYNISNREPDDVMRVDLLREDGVGDLLVELGLLTEMEAARLEAKYAFENEGSE